VTRALYKHIPSSINRVRALLCHKPLIDYPFVLSSRPGRMYRVTSINERLIGTMQPQSLARQTPSNTTRTGSAARVICRAENSAVPSDGNLTRRATLAAGSVLLSSAVLRPPLDGYCAEVQTASIAKATDTTAVAATTILRATIAPELEISRVYRPVPSHWSRRMTSSQLIS
jgi:hypothetical protein